MIYDASLDDLLHKTWEGQRVNQAEALRLYHLPLEELGALADRRRQLAKAGAYDGRGNEIVHERSSLGRRRAGNRAAREVDLRRLLGGQDRLRRLPGLLRPRGKRQACHRTPENEVAPSH